MMMSILKVIMKSNTNFLYAEIILTKNKTLPYWLRLVNQPSAHCLILVLRHNTGTSTNFKGWVVTTQILISLNKLFIDQSLSYLNLLNVFHLRGNMIFEFNIHFVICFFLYVPLFLIKKKDSFILTVWKLVLQLEHHVKDIRTLSGCILDQKRALTCQVTGPLDHLAVLRLPTSLI